MELHQQVQALTLQLEHAQRSQEGFNDQVSDLHVELVSTKAQANHQDQEKVRMKEKLETIQQVTLGVTNGLRGHPLVLLTLGWPLFSVTVAFRANPPLGDRGTGDPA